METWYNDATTNFQVNRPEEKTTKQLDAAYDTEMARAFELLKAIPVAIQENMVAPDQAAAADAMITWDDVAAIKNINGLLAEVVSIIKSEH